MQRGLPCEHCGSSDAVAEYSDGHTYCYSCEKHTKGDGATRKQADTPTDWRPVHGEYRALMKRGITEETCRKYGYTVGHFNGTPVHICNVRTEHGGLVAQKMRTADKRFIVQGKLRNDVLVGMHLFSGGKRLVITEGELDMLSLAQAQGNKWPVVSLPNGAQSARKTLLECADYLRKFEEVVLCFDSDPVGVEAARKTAEALTGLVPILIAKLPLKDANEMLLAGQTRELVAAIWDATAYKPDGLLEVDEILEDLFVDEQPGLPWKFAGMNASSNGRFFGEVHTLGAGTGLGKTTLLIEQAEYDMTELGQKVGLFMVENDPKELLRNVCGKGDRELYHVRNTPAYDNHDAIRKAAQRYRNKLYVYDNWGLCEWDAVKAKMLYLIGKGYRVFYIDHLTALATGGGLDEKKEIERVMAEIASMAQRHSILIHVVSHLSTPEHGSHECGARVEIRHFKGSRSIGFWSHVMYGLERDQQADDVNERLITTVRQLKRRGFGQGVGKLTYLRYDASSDTSMETSGSATQNDYQFTDHSNSF